MEKIAPLLPDAGMELLQIARRTLEAYIESREFLQIEPVSEGLREKRGAFVTLSRRAPAGDTFRLRGCIGRMVADAPLFLTVQEMAVQAATGDPRFPPVTSEELPDLEIEISVLSPLRVVKDVSGIEVGRDGLVVSSGFCRGVLLPQVAVQERWDRETFLDKTCLKAGLSPGSWRSTKTKIEAFSADVFGEVHDRA